MMVSIRSGCVLAFALGTLFLVGCSGDSSKVTGIVTLDGEPVPGAQITFSSEDLEPQEVYLATSDEKGGYELIIPNETTISPATYAVTVTKLVTKKGVQLSEELDLEQLEASGMVHNALPQQYGRIELTPLKVPVEAGSNDIPLKLVTK